MAFSFVETQRVPHAEGLIGVDAEQMAAIRREAERRSVTAPLDAKRVSSEYVRRFFLGPRLEVPDAKAAIIAG